MGLLKVYRWSSHAIREDGSLYGREMSKFYGTVNIR